MKMLDGTNFISNIGGFQICDLHLVMYVNNNYECACGEVHTFNYDSEILCQGAFKLVLECPNNKEYITCLKLKSKFLGFGFSRFESLYGTKLSKTSDDPEDSLILFHYVIKKHIGEI